MKKITTVLVPLAVIALMFSAQFSVATFGVNIGDTFVYDCVKSELDITIGTESATGQGYSIDGHHFDQGTSVNVEVTDIDTLEVEYELSSGSYMEVEYSSMLGFAFLSIFAIIYPVLILALGADPANFNSTAASEDPGLLMVPFVANETDTWDGFKEMVTSVQTATLVSTDDFGPVYFNATYTDDASTFVFESYMGGEFNFTDTFTSGSYYVNAEVEHHFQFAYQKATGVMLGMRLEGAIEGTTNGTEISMHYNQHTEKSGYNLPAYTFGGGFVFIPGFEWFVGITAIASLCVLPILIRRKK